MDIPTQWLLIHSICSHPLLASLYILSHHLKHYCSQPKFNISSSTIFVQFTFTNVYVPAKELMIKLYSLPLHLSWATMIWAEPFGNEYLHIPIPKIRVHESLILIPCYLHPLHTRHSSLIILNALHRLSIHYSIIPIPTSSCTQPTWYDEVMNITNANRKREQRHLLSWTSVLLCLPLLQRLCLTVDKGPLLSLSLQSPIHNIKFKHSS